MGARASGQNLLDQLAVNVGQAEVASGVAISKLRVIEAQQVEHRGMQVVDMHAVLDRLEAEFVGRADNLPPLDAATGQPASKAIMIVIAAGDLARVVARAGQLDRGGTAEL